MSNQKRKRTNKNLAAVLIISGAIHLAVFLVLGSLVIFTSVPQSKPEFEQAVILEAIELEPLQMKQDMSKMVRTGGSAGSTGAPQRSLIALQTPTANVTPLAMTISPVMGMGTGSSVGPGAGMGTGVGSGYGSGTGDGLGGLGGRSGLAIGNRAVSFLGLQSGGERVAILVDCSDYMLEDEKGGLHAFRIVKDECVKVVESLQPGVMFNVYLFSRWQINRFRPHMVASTPRVITELREWITPINETVQGRGINQNNFTPEKEYFSGKFHWVNWPRALHAAMDDQAESIFMIMATFPNIREEWEDLPPRDRDRALREHERRKREHERELEKWKGSREERAFNEWHETYRAPVHKKAQEIWDAEQAKRRAAGRPERIVVGNHILITMRENNLKYEKPHPPGPPTYHPYWDYTNARLIERFREELIREMYRMQNKPDPSVNIILFGKDERASKNWQEFVAGVNRGRRGQFRQIQSLVEMQAAASQSSEQRQQR